MNTQTTEKTQIFTCDQCKREMSIVQDGPYRDMQVENVKPEKVSLKQRIRKLWRVWHWNFGRLSQLPRWVWPVAIGLVLLSCGSVFSHTVLKLFVGLIAIVVVGSVVVFAGGFLLWLLGYLTAKFVFRLPPDRWEYKDSEILRLIGVIPIIVVPVVLWIMWMVGNVIVK